MADARLIPENYPIRLEGACLGLGIVPLGAVLREGLGEVGGATIEFLCTDRSLDMQALVGKPMPLVMGDVHTGPRWFRGTCVSLECVRTWPGFARFRAETRPWLWFLGRRRASRIFQDMSVPDIIMLILNEHGFSGDVEQSLGGSYPARTYCTQYRETDLDFLHRLMQQEGLYYYFLPDHDTERMVLTDAISGHSPLPLDPVLTYIDRSQGGATQKPHVSDWAGGQAVRSGKVTLDDYDFRTPRADLSVTNAAPPGAHADTAHEIYDYPGGYTDTAEGERYVRLRMEAEAMRHQVWQGSANASRIAAGRTFVLRDAPRARDPLEMLVIGAVHYVRQSPADLDQAADPADIERRMGLPPMGEDPWLVRFEAIPQDVPFRPARSQPAPIVAGVQTAIVSGPEGEEIHTDEYGRVKVQFHWDRDGRRDENTTCWVRVAVPWTGKNWGMIAVPRIGQEVVVQFEEGDPDRPLITGMLYNGDTMPPWALPANMTQSGVRTNSTKGGGGYNELMFEDRKGQELVRFRAERDYTQMVQNDATITVGLEDKDKGDMSLTVHRNLTERLDTGDHSFTVAAGNQTIAIKKDRKDTVEGSSVLTVTGDVTETVQQGSVAKTIEMGSFSHALKMGNHDTTLDMGNYSLTASLGSQSFEAMQKIELKVGANSITVDQSGVTIKGLIVKIEGTVLAELKAPMTTVKGDALLVLKGTMTMIN